MGSLFTCVNLDKSQETDSGYGLIDALFLNIMPALATWEAFTCLGWTKPLIGMIATGALALIASLLVAAAYHLGYPEFRNARLRLVLFGNSLITLAYILPGSPWER